MNQFMNESILHFGALRFRITGTGQMTATVYNLDKTQSFTPNSIQMDGIDGSEPLILTNLNTQRAILRMETNTQGAYFEVSRIVLYQKPIWEDYPS